jgi:hypothetical protein
VQLALALQLAVFAAHSSTSVQVLPSPVKPGLQAQAKPPAVFVQVALALQFEVPAVHSFTSVQVTPSPA